MLFVLTRHVLFDILSLEDEDDMKYEKMIEKQSRLNSNKQIDLVSGEQLESFLKSIIEDKNLENELKAFIILSISGGLRVSEVRQLKKEHIYEIDGNVFGKIKVLKKSRTEYREFIIHPIAKSFLKDYAKSVIGHLVKSSQPTLYRKIQATFGGDFCNHSLRHSLISYLLFEKNMNHLKAAKLMHMGVKTIEHYAHLNERKTLKEIF